MSELGPSFMATYEEDVFSPVIKYYLDRMESNIVNQVGAYPFSNLGDIETDLTDIICTQFAETKIDL